LHTQRHSIAQLLQQGRLHHQQGQPDLAETCYRQILERQPRNFDAAYLLGLLRLQSSDPVQASALLQRAAKINPSDPSTHTLLGIALQGSGHSEASLTHFRRAATLAPGNAEFHYNLGKALRATRQFDEARKAYETAIQLQPDYTEAYNNLSEVLTTLKLPEKAVEAAETALQLHPRHAEALSNRGAALLLLRQWSQALADLSEALTIKPDLKKALVNRGTALLNLNRHDEAQADFAQALLRDPADSLVRWNLALCQLLLGNFREGWNNYKARWNTVMEGLHPRFPQPLWDGASFTGRLLIWADQGLGDQILFASMFPEVARQAPDVRFAVAPRLLTLLQRSFAGLRFCSHQEVRNDGAFDAYAFTSDLGKFFRNTIDDCLSRRRTYLLADEALTRQLHKRISSSKRMICGLSWISKNESFGCEKSMELAQLSAAFNGLNYEWIDLQYGDTEAERLAVSGSGGIVVKREPTIDTLNDIDGLSSLIDACDVVVTISNTTAHLAGALGKRVLLMLPYSAGRFWCWQKDREDSLWYPNVRIFRQPKEGDWASVIAAVREALITVQSQP